MASCSIRQLQNCRTSSLWPGENTRGGFPVAGQGEGYLHPPGGHHLEHDSPGEAPWAHGLMDGGQIPSASPTHGVCIGSRLSCGVGQLIPGLASHTSAPRDACPEPSLLQRDALASPAAQPAAPQLCRWRGNRSSKQWGSSTGPTGPTAVAAPTQKPQVQPQAAGLAPGADRALGWAWGGDSTDPSALSCPSRAAPPAVLNAASHPADGVKRSC